MSSTFGADFEQLRKDAFGPFVEHMTGVLHKFETDSSAHLPVLDHTRGDLDEAVEQAVGPGQDETRGILTGLAELTTGDTSRVQDMTRRLQQTEDEATDAAGFVSTETTHH